MRNYSKGSEWRRWDLHVHTPGTKKNDNYNGNTLEQKWENFYNRISDYVGDGSDLNKNIEVIGITDYLSVDNYKKVIDDNRLPETILLVLPNIEMRIQPIATDSPVNIHFIFAPKLVESLESRFFGKLSFSYGGTNFSARRDELIRLGRMLDDSADECKAYKLGISQFIPSLDSIKKVFEDSELRQFTIIGVSNSSTDGASGITALSSYCEGDGSPSQLTLSRQSIYQFVDFIFSSRQGDIDYFLGEKTDNQETVIKKCGSLKPCLHGSDAHELNKVFEPDNNKYCWIKANPTFNGFRQTIYEPKERVRISPLLPESKANYHVIDHVVIDHPDFAKEGIYFNDKLTCIIGGKSTGKSTLLNNMAIAIDKGQVEAKMNTAKANYKIVPNLKVFWADGTVSPSLRSDTSHKIVYIPQTYLNRLSDNNQEFTEIDNIIQDIVLINDDAQKAYELMEKSLQEFKPMLDRNIYDLVQVYKELYNIDLQKKEIGTSEGIQKEISKLNEQKKLITEELSLSPDDIQRYDEALTKLKSANEQIQKCNIEYEYISNINSVVNPISLSTILSDKTMSQVKLAINHAIMIANEDWVGYKEEILKQLSEEKNKINDIINENEKIKESLNSKITGNEAVNKLTNSIHTEQDKLVKLDSLEKTYQEKNSTFNELLNLLALTFVKYDEIHSVYVAAVNGNPELICSDLEFSVTVPFRSDAFCQMIKGLFDNRTLRTRNDIIKIDAFEIEDFTIDKIKALIKACLNGTLPLVKDRTPEMALRSIFEDWYNINYSVKMDSDSIDQMSPGKKALVLLKLLINLADSKSPILIDQPEDDLDNRSVFDDLIPFIRDKKVIRQIIVVTHNANVVLGGDAEEIIVANQEGINTPNKKFRFEYRSGAIEDDLPIYDEIGEVKLGILNKQGIQQHICDILEGGEKAFDLRKHKYRISL